MKKVAFLTIFCSLFVFCSLRIPAQDTIRHLIISEIRHDLWSHFYVEFTNMHPTDPVFLGEFVYYALRDQNLMYVQEGDEVVIAEGQTLRNSSVQRLPDQWLAAGESFVFMNVQDGWNGTFSKHPRMIHSPGIVKIADLFNHFPDWTGGDPALEQTPYLPELQCWGFDSISNPYGMGFARMGDGAALIWYPNDTVMVMVDQALAEVNWDLGTMDNDYSGATPWVSTAGIPGANENFTLVRKFLIKEGQTNWTMAKGSDAASSSWILIPHNDDNGHMAPTTVGNHWDFQLTYSSGVYDIDETNSILTVPWGTEKFDSIINHLNLGSGMAWEYHENGNAEDSLSMICKDGDRLVLYACGNSLQTREFTIAVDPPLTSDNTVFGKRRMVYPDPESDDYVPGSVAVVDISFVPAYQVDEFTTVIDTIGYVPFATKVDTFMNLLEKPPNAGWEIIFKSGEASSEVSDGDILRVTAQNMSIKDYYIQVEDYVPGIDVTLASITWPDRPDIFMDGWGYDGFSDTIPNFSPAATSYFLTLPPGTTSVPALVFKPGDANADVEVERAISLKGGVAERTTTIDITSESGLSLLSVKIVFDVLNPTPQKYEGDPIFAKFYFRDWWGAGGFEILNPTDYVLDLSDYMVVRSEGSTKIDGLIHNWNADTTDWSWRYKRFVPGYKWGDYTEWLNNPRRNLQLDPAVNPFLDPKQVFTAWRIHQNYEVTWKSMSDILDPANNPASPVDVLFNNDFSINPGVFVNPWGEALDANQTVGYPVHVNNTGTNTGIYYLLKMKNDSIRLGTKDPDDPDDYEVVDVMGSTVTPWNMNGTEMTLGECYLAWRKANVYYGDTILGQRNSLTNPDDSQWDVWQTYPSNAPTTELTRNNNKQFLGSHPIDPVTGHLSIVYSLVYNVSRGYSESETIVGVSNGETVSNFLSNIIKPDPTQVLKVTAGGIEKSHGDAVAQGDVLEVTSQTGNLTKYTISLAAISGDAALTAVDGDVTIVTIAPAGTISNFAFGASLRFVLENVIVPLNATLNIIDSEGNLVPLQVPDSEGSPTDLVASTEHYFEVVAENGNTITYHLQPASASSDAYVTSGVYDVQETARLITGMEEGTGVQAFLANLTPVTGATMKVLLITGQERVQGHLAVDDMLEVVSQDMTTTRVYYLFEYAGAIIEPPVPVDPTCFGGTNGSISVNVYNAAEPVSYSNDGGTSWQSESVFNDLAAGEYHLWIQDLSGLIYQDTVEINQPSDIVSNLTKTDIDCTSGALGSIDLTISGGAPPYGILWSNDSTSENISGLLNGKYVVSINDTDGCMIEDSIIINAANHLSLPGAESESVVSGQPVPDLCATGSNIRWYDKDKIFLATGDCYPTGKTAVGDYTYFITQNADNAPEECESGFKEVVLSIHPSISISDTAICKGDTAVYKRPAANPDTYKWKVLSTGQVLSNSNTVDLDPEETTEYLYEERVSQLTFMYDTFTVTVTPMPVFDIAVDNNPSMPGAGNSSTVIVGGDGTFEWKPNTNVALISGGVHKVTPEENTTYTITATTDAGCSADTTLDLYVYCEDCSDSIYSAPTGLINHGCTNRNYVNGADCKFTIYPAKTKWIKLVFNKEAFDIRSGDKISVYDGINANAALIGAYHNDNLPPDTITSSGSDLFLHFESDGAGTGSGFQVQYYSDYVNTLNDVRERSILIYPNPNSGSFTLEMEGTKFRKAELEIFSSLGRKVHNREIHPVSGFVQETIDLGEMPPGIYYIRMKTPDAVYRKSIILN